MFDIPDSVPQQAPDQIVVTASRFPEPPATSAASVSIVDQAEISHLSSPFVTDYLRLLPSVAVAVSGPAGSQTDVRIRGAEANQTLLFIDGIRANDPAAGNAAALRTAECRYRVAHRTGPRAAIGAVGIGGHRRGCRG